MPRLNGRFRSTFLAIAFALFPIPLFGADGTGPANGAEILVKGKDIAITRQEFDAELARFEAETTNRGEAVVEEARPRLKAELLDRMIFRRLVMAQATDVDKRRAMFEANAFINGAKADAPTPEAHRRRLKLAGFTEETFAADKYAEILSATVLDRVIRAGIRIDDGTLRVAYEAEPERWQKPASFRGIDLMMSSKDPVTGGELEGIA